MKSHLKVKVFTLSAEMTYIRRQEEKWKTKARIARARQKESLKYCEDNFWSHRIHRTTLKFEARHTHLAYGFMKGVPYSMMEPMCYGIFKGYGTPKPNWDKISDMVERFSKDEPDQRAIMQRYEEWLENAKKWFKGNDQRIYFFKEYQKLRNERQANDPLYQAQKKALANKARVANGLEPL